MNRCALVEFSCPLFLPKNREFYIYSVGPKIKKAETRIFWDLSSDYTGVAVVGLGKMNAGINELEELHEGKENVRTAAAAGCRALDNNDIKDIVLENLGDAEAAAEGAFLSTWIYQEFKSKENQKESPKVSLYGNEGENEWKVGQIKAEAQNWSRKLTDTPANRMTPAIFCEEVCSKLKPYGIDVQVHDKEWAEKKSMGSFLSVSRGSCIPPKFLEISYKGAKNSKDAPIVFVGKGVTFDSGGISIKGSLDMDLMRADMGGAACLVATMKAAAELKLQLNIVGLIPLTENMPSGSATKPGDVVIAMNGKSIIVDNTDAEGRLILADALCYSQEFNPRFVVDIATLTGAMKISLSSTATGVWTNDKALFDVLQKAGTITGDRVWRFPLWQIFADRVKKLGRSADLNNMVKGGKGASCFAAAFLREFVGEKTPWMHLDIASVMDISGSDDSPYLPSMGMSGRPTRTLIQFVQQLSQ